MGCDIHMVLEQRRKDTGHWIGLRDFDGIPRKCFSNIPKSEEGAFDRWCWWLVKERNYEVFNALAGVRGNGSPLGYEPRGIPDDASDLSQMMIDGWGEDGHSHSWLFIKEAIPAYEPIHELVASRLTGDGEPLIKFAEELFGIDSAETAADLDDYRIVFLFDN